METHSVVAVFVLLSCSVAAAEGDWKAERAIGRGAKDEEGCAGFGSCCPAKNVSCYGRGPTKNNETADRCFCDEDCLRLDDCCLDYGLFCKTVDCVLSEEWSDWTDCSRFCGGGWQKRTRQVVVQPKNGGQECRGQVQRRKCERFHCKHPPHKRSEEGKVNETANIVPAVYASWRTNALYNPLQDIRRTLFLHQRKHSAMPDNKKPSYCATFRVTETRSACHRRPTTAASGGGGGASAGATEGVLSVGQTVCVECQEAFGAAQTPSGRCLGDGIVGRETGWNAVVMPRCHGKWTMTSEHVVPCHCNSKSETSFVFV